MIYISISGYEDDASRLTFTKGLGGHDDNEVINVNINHPNLDDQLCITVNLEALKEVLYQL